MVWILLENMLPCRIYPRCYLYTLLGIVIIQAIMSLSFNSSIHVFVENAPMVQDVWLGSDVVPPWSTLVSLLQKFPQWCKLSTYTPEMMNFDFVFFTYRLILEGSHVNFEFSKIYVAYNAIFLEIVLTSVYIALWKTMSLERCTTFPIASMSTSYALYSTSLKIYRLAFHECQYKWH